MNFTFRQDLNKETILSRIPEEQIMEYYTHIPVRKGLFVSKIRIDHKPTVSYYRNAKGELIYKDFATGQHLNIFAVVQEICHCDYHRALQIIANDFGIVKNDFIPVTPGKINSNYTRLSEKTISKIQVEIQPFSELELKWWIKYGITPEILKHFDVYSCKHVFLNGKLMFKSQQHCPIYGYYGGTIKKDGDKIELWKCYFPKRKEYRFIGNYPVTKLQGYNKLPKKGKVCVITKALKDVMTFYSYGIPACAPNSETVIPKESIVNELLDRFDNVFCMWDNDITGVSFLNKIKKKYPKLKCLIIPRKYDAKDFSDLRAKYGYSKTKELIVKYLKWIKK